jgi:hypothetical protein
MNFILPSDFETAATQMAAMVFPTTRFQVLAKEIGIGNLAITFKSPRHFSENFRIKFYPKLQTLIISGYYDDGMAHLTYTLNKNYQWHNGLGCKIDKPANIGDKFEFLSRKFFPLLQEFFITEDFTRFSLSRDFETLVTKIAEQAFPDYNFNLSYWKYGEKEFCLHFQGDKTIEIQTSELPSNILSIKESISFDVDFRTEPKCLTISTKCNEEQYLLYYNSIGTVSWSTVQIDEIKPPSGLDKKLEIIALNLYPLLQEFLQ